MCCGSLVGSTTTAKATYVVKLFSPLNEQPVFFLKWFYGISNYTKWRKHGESVIFSYSLRKSNTDCFSLSAVQISNAYNLWASIYFFKYISKSPQPATGLTEANIFTSAANLETTSSLMSPCFYCRRKPKYPENPWKHQVSTCKPKCEQNRRIPIFTWLSI